MKYKTSVSPSFTLYLWKKKTLFLFFSTSSLELNNIPENAVITWFLKHRYYHGQVIPLNLEGPEINSWLTDTLFLITVPQTVSVIYLFLFLKEWSPAMKQYCHLLNTWNILHIFLRLQDSNGAYKLMAWLHQNSFGRCFILFIFWKLF